MRRLEGSTLLVTGANRGLGTAFVEVALARGARRVYAASRDPLALEPLAARHGNRVVPLPLDVSDTAQIRAAGTVATDIDLLVNNAGLTPSADFFDCSDAEYRQLVDVNYLGPVFLTRRFAPILAARKGSIIHVASIAALVSGSRAPVYHGTKAALVAMALSLRAELAAMGIGTSIVYPGFVATRMTDRHQRPKADPRDVARHVFDRWENGDLSIFPDPYARHVRDALHAAATEPGEGPDMIAVANYMKQHAEAD